MLEAKCDKYGRDLTIVDRWYPSSQVCSCCGKSGGKKELDVREWECLFCNTVHDRDINAATNLNRYHKGTMWAGGQSDQYNNGVEHGRETRPFPPHERGASVSLAVPAVCGEALTIPKQLKLF